MIMPIAPIKEYNSKAKKEAKLEESQNINALNEQSSISTKKPVQKDFEKALNSLVMTNFYDNSMVSKQDIYKAKKANEMKQIEFDDVTARLWDCHDKHVERVETLRLQLEEERFKKGGDLD